MSVGDTVWWIGAAGTRRKVRLTEDLGEAFRYRTVSGLCGWESSDRKSMFRPIGRKR